MVYGIYPRCYEAEPSNPEGIPYTTASEESMWLVPQLTAFHQSQAEKSIPLCNTFGFGQLREQRPEKCGLCPITIHFSRPLIGGRQATVVQAQETGWKSGVWSCIKPGLPTHLLQESNVGNVNSLLIYFGRLSFSITKFS